MQISQKDAVYKACISVLKENNVDFEEGIDVLSDVLDKDLRSSVVGIIVENFNQNKIVLNKAHIKEDLHRYVSSLVSNWSKKDSRLNGNIEYQIKKPGSKAGNTDPMIRELRKFLKQVKGTVHEISVKKEINERIHTLRKEQTKDIVINKQLIPESIRYLVVN